MSIGNASANIAVLQWKANSAYDVNPVIGSTSTPGFSEWAAMYYNYRVMGGKLSITILNGDSVNPIYFGIYFTNSANGPANWTAAMGMRGNAYSKQVLLTPNNGDAKATRTLSIYCPLGKLLGEPKMYRVDDSYQSFTTGNPSVLLYMYAYVLNYNGSTVSPLLPAICPIKTEYVMYVDFFAKKPLTA